MLIHGFNTRGLAALQAGSSRPHRLRTTFPDEALEALQDLLHRRPRYAGPPDQCVDFAPCRSDELSAGTHLSTRLWREYPPRSQTLWWSRFALPHLHAWQDKHQPVRLVEQPWKKGDPDPKALACYGVLWQHGSAAEPVRKQMSLRFVTGRPVSAITTQFLEWCCARLQAQGKTAWLLIWDNASFHVSKMVRTWIREHNHQIKQEGKGVRILPFFLPTKSPWLNPIVPKWVHAKKAIVAPDGLLSAQQLAQRVCAHFGCSYEPPLSIVEEVA